MRTPSPLNLALALALLALTPAVALAQAPSYMLFESGQVRPLALSPDGTKLFAVNTPDAQLEIFDVDGGGMLSRVGSVQVGLEPVAVAARTNDEVWVVNHLSDSVSIVQLTPAPRVVRTLLVGDEPGDIAFTSTSSGDWAFVTTAHRGQHSPNGGRASRISGNSPDASQFDTPGIGRADVWVFDASDPGSELGGAPANVITLFGDKPRALAVSNDGNSIYAAIHHSGNRTTVVNEGLVCPTSSGRFSNNNVQPSCTINGVAIPGGYPPPHKNHAGDDRPETGLILKFDRSGSPTGTWSDELDRNWNPVVKFDLPDRDVFEIDATLDPPAAVDASSTCADGGGCWAGVGTILFNMAVNPVSGKVYVANTDAQNHVRFEGAGVHASDPDDGKHPTSVDPDTVRGNLAQSRITVLDGANVNPRHLNNHLNYDDYPAPASDKAKSLATPLGMEVTADGNTLFVAAFGSDKIGVYDTAELENDTFDPDVTNPAAAGFVEHIAVGGGGPTGLALGASKLYVMTRYDNAVRVLDLGSRTEEQTLALHSPEPAEIIEGRPFLYSAQLTSSNGEASCSSCHVFGDLDSLGWDLGDPDGDVVANGNDFNGLVPAQFDPLPREFHPSKGPMTTQSLRGLANMGPQHWRGDRQGDEIAAFEAFNVAFPGLVGSAAQLSSSDMTKFRRFALALRYPPNPIRKLGNDLRPGEQNGFILYNGRTTDTVSNCQGCHTLDPANGHFGGNGQTIFDGETQHLKVPHLRNQYQKVGMFGMSEPEPVQFGGAGGLVFTGDFSHQGDQIRGFGFIHNGSVDSMSRFLGLTGFSMDATEEDEMEDYVMAFDTDLAPIVGQQVTVDSTNRSWPDMIVQLDRLEERARTGFTSEILGAGAKECELITKVSEGGVERGYLYDGQSRLYQPDDGSPDLSETAMRDKALATGQEITYTCVPFGSGHRMALDRDEDTLLNGVETGTRIFVSASDTGTSPALADSDFDGFDDDVEVQAGTDPNNALDFPGAPPPPEVPLTGGLARLSIALLLTATAGWSLKRRGLASAG